VELQQQINLEHKLKAYILKNQMKVLTILFHSLDKARMHLELNSGSAETHGDHILERMGISEFKCTPTTCKLRQIVYGLYLVLQLQVLLLLNDIK